MPIQAGLTQDSPTEGGTRAVDVDGDDAFVCDVVDSGCDGGPVNE